MHRRGAHALNDENVRWLDVRVEQSEAVQVLHAVQDTPEGTTQGRGRQWCLAGAQLIRKRATPKLVHRDRAALMAGAGKPVHVRIENPREVRMAAALVCHIRLVQGGLQLSPPAHS